MIEKLLENWLDSASERSYQPVFVQLLAAEGYKVLHSTRHCLLEFGRDILAVAPDGVGCAFQLKGAPKGRMTIAEFRRDIQPQLVQLMSQASSYPGFPVGPHRAYLVSNGQFEEEVQTAVREMNQMPYPSKVELWSRGTLFDLCRKHGALLWPGELEDNRALLEIYLANPKDQLPITSFANMLASILKLNASETRLTRQEFSRAINSATWLTGISTATFAENENHQAVAYAWTICAVSILGAAEKHTDQSSQGFTSTVELAEMAIFDALSALWAELDERKHFVEGDPMTDPEVFGWRMSVLFGLLSCLLIGNMHRPILTEKTKSSLENWLKTVRFRGVLWGEASIAYLTPWLVWLRKNDATSLPDELIALFAKVVVEKNQPNAVSPLASPYYDGETVLRYKAKLPGKARGQIAEDEKFAGAAYTAEPLMHLLVRTRNKGYCRSLWPAFTRIVHERFRLNSIADYCLVKASTGINETMVYPSTYEWSKLRSDALTRPSLNSIPETLRKRPWLLAMWWQVAPHRFNSEALYHFSEAVIPHWGN